MFVKVSMFVCFFLFYKGAKSTKVEVVAASINVIVYPTQSKVPKMTIN